MESLGQEVKFNSDKNGDSSILPVGNRRFIKTSKLTKDKLITAFKDAKIID